jgi:hypothetical protein
MSIESKEIFLRGFSYQSASEQLRHSSNPNVNNHGYPAIHLSFLASEMYLKALHHQISGTAPRGHRLSVLFGNLPKPERKAINERWIEYYNKAPFKLFFATVGEKPPSDPALVYFLDRGDFMFERSRYTWEPGGAQNSMFVLTDLPGVVCKYILDRHPDWAPPFKEPVKAV